MKLKYLGKKPLLSLVLISLLILSACSDPSDKSSNEKDATEEKGKTEEDPEGIRLTQGQLDAVGIKLGTLEEKNLKAVVKASGQLEVPPQNRAEVTLLLGGIVKQVFVLEGQHVNKGQKLASIGNTQVIQLQQDYTSALSSLAYATKEYERQRELNEANAGTGKVYQQAESTLRSEQAKVASLRGQLRQLGIDPAAASRGSVTSSIPVFAPISGTVGKIGIETGSYVEPARPLMNIVDNSKVHCDLIVYEKDLFKVKAGQQVSFVLTNQDNREITGKIYGINQSFENESKAIIAHAVIEQAAKNNLIQGMYVSALIDVGQQQVTAVPSGAIVKSGGKAYIYHLKQMTDDKEGGKQYVFGQAEVVSGVNDLGYTEIKLITPLPKGAKIVTSGAFYILSAQKAVGDDD
ncbi:efflux RND transporter periplasmic adaptor subunit [Mucilaginibacter segetis]|uniref:Efflux RND transporter periplasmic adaptor subunit n=1 Tax=Mucilaginibacter segetis TaxID=2793071 RepID=A0A934PTF8_9SPHI|nr:efflux RND transporter periplasmic adaptor subunit [Mucilaginibacter segetis]MBK0379227.1 efflux RND transporter periplasmic adaptor subunit [Mucilaginibacter segetis]